MTDKPTRKNGSGRVTEAFLAHAGKGRPKGVPNKLTMEAKEAIAMAAEGLGGVSRLIEWAQESPENEAKFWSAIYPRLIPVTVANAPGETFKVSQVNDDADRFRSRLIQSLAAGTAAGGTIESKH